MARPQVALDALAATVGATVAWFLCVAQQSGYYISGACGSITYCTPPPAVPFGPSLGTQAIYIVIGTAMSVGLAEIGRRFVSRRMRS